MLSKVLIIFLLLGCEEAELADRSRPLEDGDDLPAYLDETTQSAKANEPFVITHSQTTVTIARNSLAQDAEIRMRTLKTQPEREETASLGSAIGDVIELTMYNKQTEQIYASSILNEAYLVSQVIGDFSNEADLKFVAITSPGTDQETVQVLSRKAIIVSTSLALVNTTVSINLNATHVIFYAIESAHVSSVVTILDSGDDTSNEAGGSVASSGSSSGNSINCSNLKGGEWIPVPANPVVGQVDDFCIMKYEAGNDVDNKPISNAAYSPVTGISQVEALAACERLGSRYELIRNTAAQTIARNIETAQDSNGVYLNWSGGDIAGDSQLNRGHSDENPVGVCDGSVENVQNDCTTSDSATPHSQKRTHTLSNGEVIWDFAGNAWEWSATFINNLGDSGAVADKTWDGQIGFEDAALKIFFGPTHTYFDDDAADYRKGYDSGGLGGWSFNAGSTAFLRGGDWRSHVDSGVFAADLLRFPTDTATDMGGSFGFRCMTLANQ